MDKKDKIREIILFLGFAQIVRTMFMKLCSSKIKEELDRKLLEKEDLALLIRGEDGEDVEPFVEMEQKLMDELVDNIDKQLRNVEVNAIYSAVSQLHMRSFMRTFQQALNGEVECLNDRMNGHMTSAKGKPLMNKLQGLIRQALYLA